MYYSILINYAEEGSLQKLKIVRNINIRNKEELLAVLFNEIDMGPGTERLHLADTSVKDLLEEGSWASVLGDESIVH